MASTFPFPPVSLMSTWILRLFMHLLQQLRAPEPTRILLRLNGHAPLQPTFHLPPRSSIMTGQNHLSNRLQRQFPRADVLITNRQRMLRKFKTRLLLPIRPPSLPSVQPCLLQATARLIKMNTKSLRRSPLPIPSPQPVEF